MRLEDYLEALKSCPDEQLTKELGVYDNWPIFLNLPFDEILDKLSENHALTELRIASNYAILNHRLGTVVMQVLGREQGRPWKPQEVDLLCGGLRMADGSTRIDPNYENRTYSSMLMLHPYQTIRMSDTTSERALSHVITEIGELAVAKHVSLCFTRSAGWNNIWDSSRIVYYPN
jgi:hypothetical protein